MFGVAVGVFYWYSYRPTKIRQECSWIEKSGTTRRVTGQPRLDLTEEEKRWIEDEPKIDFLDQIKYWDDIVKRTTTGLRSYDAGTRLKNSLYVMVEEPYHYWTKATDNEYEFCVQAKGITK